MLRYVYRDRAAQHETLKFYIQEDCTLDPTSDSQPQIHHIYALALAGTSYIHVSHTVVDRISKFFTKHEEGRIGATAPMAKEAAQKHNQLSLFLLEDYLTSSDVDAYHRCIAWQQLAVQAGYTPQSAADCRHLARMNDAEHAHYEQLRHCDIRALCSPERDLAPGILARRRGPQNNKKSRTIRVTIPRSDYNTLVKTARVRGFKLPAYLLACAIDASPGVDLSEIIALRAELQQALSLIRSVVVRPELTPSDIHELLNASHRISAELATVTQCLTDLTTKH